MTNTRKAAALVPATPATPATPAVEYSRTDAIKRLANANAKERILILSALPMGEVAAIGGVVSTVAASVNEVLAMKMADKHGTDWVAIAKALPANLSEADKTRRKQINESLESIRETIKANSGGDNDKARNILHRVKEWGAGKRTNKASNPKANAKQPLDVWALKWENLPTSYRRIMNDNMETMTPEQTGAMLCVADAMAEYFKVCKISPKAVLDCTGESAWKA